MGIPYSKQINAAFDQVTPLVAEGFKVLETTKNISILLAAIQVLTVVLLSLILIALVALLITCNPEFAHERQALVTPALKWFTAWMTDESSRKYLALIAMSLVIGTASGAAGGLYLMRRSTGKDLEKIGQGQPEDVAGVNEQQKSEES